MSDDSLENKLRELIVTAYSTFTDGVHHYGNNEDINDEASKAVEQIKELFQDYGWFYRGDIVLTEDATQYIPIADDPRTAYNQGLMWAVEEYVKTGRLKLDDRTV